MCSHDVYIKNKKQNDIQRIIDHNAGFSVDSDSTGY